MATPGALPAISLAPSTREALSRLRSGRPLLPWEQAKLQYELTALNAFQDVSNALISRQKYDATRAEQLREVQAYEDAVKISLQRYNSGLASYYEVLESQQLLFPAQNSLAVTELNRRVVIVQLYRSLGGGWNLNDAQWVSPPPASRPTATTDKIAATR